MVEKYNPANARERRELAKAQERLYKILSGRKSDYGLREIGNHTIRLFLCNATPKDRFIAESLIATLQTQGIPEGSSLKSASHEPVYFVEQQDQETLSVRVNKQAFHALLQRLDARWQGR